MICRLLINGMICKCFIVVVDFMVAAGTKFERLQLFANGHCRRYVFIADNKIRCNNVNINE